MILPQIHTADAPMKYLLACLLLALPVNSALATPVHTVVAPLQLAQGGGELSKSEAAAVAQRKHGGKVLNVSRSGSVYRVKLLLDSGRVKIVTVPASR